VPQGVENDGDMPEDVQETFRAEMAELADLLERGRGPKLADWRRPALPSQPLRGHRPAQSTPWLCCPPRARSPAPAKPLSRCPGTPPRPATASSSRARAPSAHAPAA
jgi:hypothetical protein